LPIAKYAALRYVARVKLSFDFPSFLSFLFAAGVLLGLSGCLVQTQNSVQGDKLAFGPPLVGSSAAFARVSAIFRTGCASCHASDIASYSEADFVAHGLVVPQIPDSSLLYQRLQGSNAGGGVPEDMPQNRAPLSQGDLEAINGWIAEMDETPVPTPLPTPSPSVSLPPTPAQAIVTIRQNFQSTVQPLVQKGCMSCHDSHAEPEGFLGHLPIIRQIEWGHIHDASAVLDFSGTFPGWSTQENDPLFFLSEIKTVIENGTMPLTEFKYFHESDGQLLTFSEDQTIVDWVDQSTQLWAKANPLPPTPSQFFSSRCLGCHNSDNSSGGFAFQKDGDQVIVPAGNTTSGIPYISQLDPGNSAVYLVLLTDPSLRKGLPQMPSGGAATDVERALILNWINKATFAKNPSQN
jgi:cytochrome c553